VTWRVAARKVARSPVDESTTKKTITTGDLVPTLLASGRPDLTDEQWAVLGPLLVKGRKPGRPRKWALQAVGPQC
jgi:hypothetical protein